ARACVDFVDVPPGRVFEAQIDWMACVGISTGWVISPGVATYGPDYPTQRDAMAAFLFRFAALSRPEVRDFVAPAVPTFVDVPTSHTFYRQIEWVASVGISRGWDNGNGTKRYEPNSPTLRDAMAAFLYRTATYLGRQDAINFWAPAVSPFADVATDRVFYKEMAWAFSTGISTGYINGCQATYDPAAPTLRDAMAAFMYRLHNGATPVSLPPCPPPPPEPEPQPEPQPWVPTPTMPADKDCSDFRTQREAQAFFDRYFDAYGDFARLDRDGDGRACETLP
ncbi:MAG: excalibur calcium-binding domain-containing protein, partial [bacterium]|nr:excalibur calcium-binding domain-containing protein [bacterium]